MAELAEHQQRFASVIYGALTRLCGAETNVALSPFSVAAALTMVWSGAGGTTAAQLTKLLFAAKGSAQQPKTDDIHHGYRRTLEALLDQTSPTKLADIRVANRMYIRDSFGIDEAYQDLVTSQYLGQLKRLSFQDAKTAARIINSEVKEVTSGKIRRIVRSSQLDADTKLLVVNTMYFRADWRHQFDPDDTSEQPFYPTSTSSVTVETMSLWGEFFFCGCVERLGCSVLNMPYEDKRVSMLLLLPDVGNTLESLEARLESEQVLAVLPELKVRRCDVQLPKFRVETSVDLSEALRDLEVTDLFQPDAADLSAVSATQDRLFVSSMRHKVVVDVNEMGTEAAASTYMEEATGGLDLDVNFWFHVNRPFMFAIVHHPLQLILFEGRVTNPQQT